MWYIGKENDIRDSDDITSGCEIFIKKEAGMRDQESSFPDFRGLFILPGMRKLRICSCLACVYRVMDARGKFGEQERSVRVARGAAESNSSFLSALQTSQVT